MANATCSRYIYFAYIGKIFLSSRDLFNRLRERDRINLPSKWQNILTSSLDNQKEKKERSNVNLLLQQNGSSSNLYTEYNVIVLGYFSLSLSVTLQFCLTQHYSGSLSLRYFFLTCEVVIVKTKSNKRGKKKKKN